MIGKALSIYLERFNRMKKKHNRATLYTHLYANFSHSFDLQYPVTLHVDTVHVHVSSILRVRRYSYMYRPSGRHALPTASIIIIAFIRRRAITETVKPYM